MNQQGVKHLSESMEQHVQEDGHPKENMSEDHKLIWRRLPQSEINRRTTSRENGNEKKPYGNWKASWREIGGKRKYFRSRWEANYARYLELLKQQNLIKDWLHEPETFWFESIKRGVRSYLPDFKIINLDDSHYWVEVKGWMDSKSKTKLKRFNKYYPNEKIEVVDSKWFSKNNKRLSCVCLGWERK